LLGLVAVVAIAVSISSAPGAEGLCGAGLAVVVLAIAVTDWRSFVIPDWLNAMGLVLGLLRAALVEPAAMVSAIASTALRALVLALAFLIVRNLYARFRGREGMGLGDVKLAAVAGTWLDIDMIPTVIELAVLVALVSYSLQRFVLRRPISPTSRLPFGVFLAPAIWAGWLIESILLAPI
jgi:leader peptidase (prepilin peptidase)/N-methyltransferase